MYCNNQCRAWASYRRRRNGDPVPPRWQHPALTSADPVLRAAAIRAQELGEAHGWADWTTRPVLDGLTTVLDELATGDTVPLSIVHNRPHRHVSRPRLAEVLDDLGLLHDDSTTAPRAWIDRVTPELTTGFAEPVRAWLLVLLDGDARAKPRSEATLYAYFGSARPVLQQWANDYEHLREVTNRDVYAALETMHGYQRNNTVQALRSLFRFAKKRGLIFTNPTMGVKTPPIDPAMTPMTDEDIRLVEQLAVQPAERLTIALAAEHAARTGTIRHLLLDHLDLPNRRITLHGHNQRLGELTDRALRTWLDHRRTTWPHTPNPHVLISARTALGASPVSQPYLRFCLGHNGFSIDRIRADRILHEALTAGPDPLHLSLVFNIDHSTALRYASVAEHLLSDKREHPHTHG